MRTGHLTEEEMQDLALDHRPATGELQEHLATCAACAAGVAGYKNLFSALVSQPEPAFDFDAVTVVTTALDKKASRSLSPFPYVVSMLILIAVLAAGMILQTDLTILFTGISQFFIYASLGGAVVIVVFQVLAIVKKYRRRFEYLSKWPELQPYSGGRVL